MPAFLVIYDQSAPFSFSITIQPIQYTKMWCLTSVESSFRLWFSDGQPINSPRGVSNVSSRLIFDTQGFLDLTELTIPRCTILDANGSKLVLPTLWSYVLSGPLPPVIKLALKIEGNGSFELTLATIMEPHHIDAGVFVESSTILDLAELRRVQGINYTCDRKAQTTSRCS